MASPQDVKQYLAYWFQLGKRVVFANDKANLPSPIYQGSQYSPAFEACWQSIMANGGQTAHLEGTDQTIAELLDSSWDLMSCARCEMPIPVPTMGCSVNLCPCNDLPTWPNDQVPKPRAAVDSRDRLAAIRQRLAQHQEG